MAKPRTVQLTTAAGEALTGQPWDVYPRPQLQRDGWINLNGEWDFGVLDDAGSCACGRPLRYEQKILVPFPPESSLSGIGKHFSEGSSLFYRRQVVLEQLPAGKTLLLHCGGVDQRAEVFWNGAPAGSLSPLTEPTDSVRLPTPKAGENELLLIVTDDLRQKAYPYGKQTRRRGGMWYTPVSGIWQTVWLEWVPERYVSALKITPTLTEVTVEVAESAAIDSVGAASGRPWASAARPYIEFEGHNWPLQDGKVVITPENPHLWTPEDPFLYEFTVKTETDEVRSYFALRTVEVKAVGGVPRLCLNCRPYFFHALLDQGYWPDGLWTPASPQCYADDILAMKRLGFNALRKHIKVEPAQFYYDCDRLGMLVLQDMVNNGRYSFLGDTLLPTLGLQKLPERLPLRRQETKTRFAQTMEATVRRLFNHPCIAYWTVFNEGWGQFAPSENYALLKSLDPTRIVDTSSGWFRGGKTDVESRHVYFKKFRLPKAKQPIVLSEFGGYSCKLEGHSFNLDKTYGYRFFKAPGAYMDALERLYRSEIVPAVKAGLCGAVFTQVSDVEDETNGLLTYDRRVCKVDGARMLAIAAALRAELQP